MHMKNFYRISITFLILLFSFTLSNAQTMDGTWSCAYATTDDGANGTGIQTITVSVVSENEFVALVSQAAPACVETDACYLVGYRNADSTHGRLGTTPYGSSSDYKQIWLNGFDQVYMDHAQDLASHGNLIFVPNNDPNYNILVFEIGTDSVVSHPKRMSTNYDPFSNDTLWAIDVDAAGNVFVTTHGLTNQPSKVLVYDSPDNESSWSSGHSADPLHIITLPDNGTARGVTVNGDGTAIYVSNYDNGKIYAYVGNTTDGYSLSPAFNFERIDQVDTTALTAAPWGLQFLNGNNILFSAMDADYELGDGYRYGNLVAINPNTGEVINELDVADWNFQITGGYSSRPNQIGIASGYTSTYNVDFDANGNMYSQSYYGWTVEKWVYSGTLPTFELTITGVEKVDSQLPTEFKLNQNYPNPFNPSTAIQFSVVERSEITLSIYSITGELITTLINSAEFESGNYEVTFNASRLSSGTYIYSISNGMNTITKKMTLLK